MFIDRREYIRIQTNIECVIFYNNNEFNGIIEDLSENGIKVKTNLDINIPEIVMISFIDTELNKVINQQFKLIRRINDEYGCFAPLYYDDEFYKYVINKKINLMLRKDVLINENWNY